ncbi:TolC family protein [Flavivirga rizhaonensis]|uniref:TolC family protein n=1 Tax=Flavivirga rizhaonensis TaxID=2559571 RepID=A0A4S1DS54_9FLAO|nr:TolC family protein [Flavivirga rizhaonensis]TGV00563.1 TolC family protein [Flavivirga rizhaonensis]
MKILFNCCIFFFSLSIVAQDTLIDSLSFQEYMGYVKQHHPLVKQANLTLNTGEANLLKAKGGFDPKIEVDFNRKKFKNTEYYNELNATFKVPTWYGVEFKANFEQNSGAFLSPDLSVPDDGLYSAGVSISLAQGLLINDRMASLKKARFFREQSKADRDLLVNNVLFEAGMAYTQWLEAANEERIFSNFLTNANTRFLAVKRSSETGQVAAIDSVEAKIALQNRKLSFEAAKLKRIKAALKASNYLWLQGIPLEIEERIFPSKPSIDDLNMALMIKQSLIDSLALDSHPKLRSLENKIEALKVDRNLKMNKLLPKLDVQYNFLSEDYEPLQRFNTANYKAFVNFSVPLFLRKERGDLKLAKLKLQDVNYERTSQMLTIKNKISAISNEMTSLDKQEDIVNDVVSNYKVLLKGEERKFFLGESSLFLINSRERSLIDAQLKENSIIIKRLESSIQFFNTLGVSPIDRIE